MKSGWEMTDNKFISYYLGCIEFQIIVLFQKKFQNSWQHNFDRIIFTVFSDTSDIIKQWRTVTLISSSIKIYS